MLLIRRFKMLCFSGWVQGTSTSQHAVDWQSRVESMHKVTAITRPLRIFSATRLADFSYDRVFSFEIISDTDTIMAGFCLFQAWRGIGFFLHNLKGNGCGSQASLCWKQSILNCTNEGRQKLLFFSVCGFKREILNVAALCYLVCSLLRP